jgi:two-component system response regulator HydG
LDELNEGPQQQKPHANGNGATTVDSTKGRILVVDDDRAMCEMLENALRRRGFEAVWRISAEEALRVLPTQDFDVVVTDLNMQGTSGLELCQQVVANRPDLPVVVVTAFGSLETAIGAIRAGAYDFVTKPFEMEDIALTLERAVQHRALHEEVKRLRRAVHDSQRFSEMIGASGSMEKVYDLITRVAETEATILITGESGTGKELVARAVHARSRRSSGPFVAINCAAMPESLLESELFGHVKGAFTDARQSRPGLFVKASGGTLFLDEIGEMPAGMQAKLLRVLQERTVRPVGGDTEVPFDARIIAATNRDLESEVAEKKFREDLYYRINVVRIHVPPLRSRGMDDLPEKLRDYKPSRVIVESEDPAELLPMEEVERRYVLRVLQAVGGNKTLAAEVLGFDRRTLYRKLERYGQAHTESRPPDSTGGSAGSD